MSDEPAPPPLFTRDFLLLVVSSFLQSMGFASMLALPIHLTDLGAGRDVVGDVLAAGAIGGLLMRPVVGWALDRFGRRPTLLAGTTLAALGLLLLGLERTAGPGVYLARVLFGVGQGAMFAGYTTLTADLVPPERRTEGLALVGTAGLLPLGLNAFIEAVHAAPGDLWVLYPGAAVAMLLSLGVLWLLPEPPRHGAGASGAPPDAWWRVLGARALLPPWLATFGLAAVVSTFMGFATIAARDRGVPWPTALWLPYAGSAVLFRIAGSQLLDRLGPHNCVAPALGFYIVALALAATADTPAAFLVAGTLAGLGHGCGFPVIVTQIVGRAPERRRGIAVAGFSALWGASDVVLSPLCGRLADRAGDAVMLGTVSMSVLALLVVWAALEHRLAPAPPWARPAG